jgi:hypothetical protein
MSRVARASFPFSPTVNVSCLTYFLVLDDKSRLSQSRAYQAFCILTNDDEVDGCFPAGFRSNLEVNNVRFRGAGSRGERTEVTGRMFA